MFVWLVAAVQVAAVGLLVTTVVVAAAVVVSCKQPSIWRLVLTL
jgi:hypothetical protein